MKRSKRASPTAGDEALMGPRVLERGGYVMPSYVMEALGEGNIVLGARALALALSDEEFESDSKLLLIPNYVSLTVNNYRAVPAI
jgi:hypothetical protein